MHPALDHFLLLGSPMRLRPSIALLLSLVVTAPLGAQAVVALDGYHNNEKPLPEHYQWEGTSDGSFSKLAGGFRAHDVELRTIRTRIDAASLQGVNLLIVVDPDTPAETPDPKYIEDSEIDVIAKWVNEGGRLVLLGNDKGHAEFTHFNRLASRFGIQFLEETYPKVSGKAILVATGRHSIFEGGLQAYLVEVAPLKLVAPAESILSDKGTDIMALARVGRGVVFAVGDPWLYDEYIERNDNARIATNLFTMLLDD
jgi:unsaturated rhamnogalacturonyl hydrolase